jgi:hypothetical protein
MWFPDKNDVEIERLAAIIWDLRREKFLREVYTNAHEREWETGEQEKRREKRNEEALIEFDLETRRIIMGAS